MARDLCLVLASIVLTQMVKSVRRPVRARAVLGSVLLFILYLPQALMAQTQAQVDACKANQCTSFCKDLDLQTKQLTQCIAQCRQSCTQTTTEPVTITPKYLIMSVGYAPPGCTATATSLCGAGNGSSQVDYNSTSSNGSKISTKDSFNLGLTISYDNSSVLPGIGGGGSYSFSNETADTSSVNVTKGQSFDWKISGNGDGIDHGQDQFLLLLHPKIKLNKQGNTILWSVTDGGAMYTAFESELQNPASMRAGTKQVFDELGLTTDDYKTMLKADPFAGILRVAGGGHLGQIETGLNQAVGVSTMGGAPATDSNGPANPGASLDQQRFWYTGINFPYQASKSDPACNGGVCNCSTITGSLSNDNVSETIHEDTGTTTVDLYGGVSVPEVYSLKVDGKMTWTTTATTDNTTESKQTATATVACPSTQYTGPQGIQVWWDSRYGSFVFLLYDPGAVPMIHQGQVKDPAGHAVAGQLVTMTLGGKTYRTYTAPDGTYKFPTWGGKTMPTGTAQILSGSLTQSVTVGKSVVLQHHPVVQKVQ